VADAWDTRNTQGSMSFYFKSGILSVVLGLTAVMVIYWVGIGGYNSTVCREQYH
jgi:hypothetical protein